MAHLMFSQTFFQHAHRREKKILSDVPIKTANCKVGIFSYLQTFLPEAFFYQNHIQVFKRTVN